MERRALAAGVNAIPDADPEAVHSFITQERRPLRTEEPNLSIAAERTARSFTAEQPQKRRRTKSAGVTPVGLIPVTVRLRPEVAGALKRASLERQLSGDDMFTQQDLVEQALEPWLRSNGYLA
jgi:hypothetical protein